MKALRNLLVGGFVYHAALRDADGNLLWKEDVHNLFPIEGMNYMLDSSIGAAAKITTLYMGIFEASYAPVISDTAATFPGASTECTAYTGSTRPAWVPNPASAGSLDNVGHEAQFTFSADKTIYGGFIISSSGKGSTLGKLISAAAFSSPQVAKSGNVLTLGGGCSLVNA